MKLKYFTPELIARANNWVEQSEEEYRRAGEEFWQTATQYSLDLKRLRPRISPEAWKFFRYGYAETGLHDAILLSLSIGDAPDGAPDNLPSLSPRWRRAAARVELMNYERTFHYTFGMRGLKRVVTDLFRDPHWEFKDEIGDLYTYELAETETGHLQFGLVFAAGATAVFEFEHLVFRRRRLRKSKKKG